MKQRSFFEEKEPEDIILPEDVRPEFDQEEERPAFVDRLRELKFDPQKKTEQGVFVILVKPGEEILPDQIIGKVSTVEELDRLLSGGWFDRAYFQKVRSAGLRLLGKLPAAQAKEDKRRRTR